MRGGLQYMDHQPIISKAGTLLLQEARFTNITAPISSSKWQWKLVGLEQCLGSRPGPILYFITNSKAAGLLFCRRVTKDSVDQTGWLITTLHSGPLLLHSGEG
jgi:hypothetical protein